MTNRTPTRAWGVCLCLTLACLSYGQTPQEGQIQVGQSAGAGFALTYPFNCNVDNVVFTNIAACVGFLDTAPFPPAAGVITSIHPEHITTLPWDPGTFSGVLILGQGQTQGGNGCPGPDCWYTDVPIIIGSGMTIEGSGRVPGGPTPNYAAGTAIAPNSSFMAALGAAPDPTLSVCSSGGAGSLQAGTYLVRVVYVDNLDSNPAVTALKVPGFSAVNNKEKMVNCASNGSSFTVTPQPLTGASDYRVFVSENPGGSGAETLQAPNFGLVCGGQGSVDRSYACSISGGAATVNMLQTTGDSPNLVDLSNPLVVEIGPLQGSGTSAQYEGFWARLENLTLAQPLTPGPNTPNVAFWNPSDQENSGLGFVSFLGPFGSTSDPSAAWIYIGNHAPNSFVSNVQTDGNPTAHSPSFYGMILDGRSGFGVTGTARIVEDSTFTPGQAGGNPAINAGAVAIGSQASVDFIDDHFELGGGISTPDCIQVVSSANVSAQGATQLCSPFIHLYNASKSPYFPQVAGNDIAVRNVKTLASQNQTVVQDEVNNVTLTVHVSDYSTAKNAASLAAQGMLTVSSATSGTATVLPPASGTPTLTLPTSAGTFVSTAFSPLSIDRTSGLVSITSPLPLTNGGTSSVNGAVTVLGGGVLAMALPTMANSYFSVGSITGTSTTEATVASPVSASGTLSAMHAQMDAPPASDVTFQARYNMASAGLTCTIHSMAGSATWCDATGGSTSITEGSGHTLDVAAHVGSAAIARTYVVQLKVVAAN